MKIFVFKLKKQERITLEMGVTVLALHGCVKMLI